jgi:hypothetical protein
MARPQQQCHPHKQQRVMRSASQVLLALLTATTTAWQTSLDC